MNIHLLSYIKSMQKNCVICIIKIMSYIEFFEKTFISQLKEKSKEKRQIIYLVEEDIPSGFS